MNAARPNTVLFAVAGSACALIAAAALLAAHALGRRRERRDFRSWETEFATGRGPVKSTGRRT